jgi:putative membrane protein
LEITLDEPGRSCLSNGPRANDVLANERTFLAYLRTSLSFVAFGFVVARFALFTRELAGLLYPGGTTQSLSTGFGTAVALFGALIAVYGGFRYVRTDRGLSSERVERLSPFAAAVGATVVGFVGVAVGIGLIAYR